MADPERVALVTGAAHGIGLGIAAGLAREGYAVAMLDINAERIEPAARAIAQQHDVATLPLIADTGTEDEVENAIGRLRSRFARLDAVVNNAGNPEPSTVAIEHLERATWDRYLEVNLTGYFLVAKHAVPLLRASGGAMVNISSIHALQSDATHNAAYAATKGGVIALTHALALSLGPVIRVNCISPGWIDTRDAETRQNEPLQDVAHVQHSVGRVGEPDRSEERRVGKEWRCGSSAEQ